MRLVALIMGIASLSLAMTSVANAQVCAYQDGGYCLSNIAYQTTTALEGRVAKVDMTAMPLGKAVSGIEGGTSYLSYYEGLWDRMIEGGEATEKEREKAFAEAKAAGGTKIGGFNLVVLSATTLQQMIDMKIITKEEAQDILNRAKTGE